MLWSFCDTLLYFQTMLMLITMMTTDGLSSLASILLLLWLTVYHSSFTWGLGYCLVISEIGDRISRVNYHWDITTTQVNSALHPSGVAKSSTSFGWGKGGKVTSVGWQVTLCDLIWHVISRSGVVISITNCYIRLTYLLTNTQSLIRDKSIEYIEFDNLATQSTTYFSVLTALRYDEIKPCGLFLFAF